MASPAVVGSPVETAISTAGTSHVVSLPSGTAGNLFIAIMSKGSAGTTPSVNALAGWQELLDEAIVLGLYAAVKQCDGTEGATTTFTLSSATRGAWIVYEISGAATTATQLPEIGTTATGSSTTPNPPSRAVTNGQKEILTLAFFGRAGEATDDDSWVTGHPSGFGNRVAKTCGTAGTNLGGLIASAELASLASTIDPGTFTAATGAWRANTIVIHPPAQDRAIAANLDVTPTLAAALTVTEKYFDDDFPGGSVNARWVTTAGAPTVASGLLRLDIEAVEGVVTAVTKDLTGAQIAWRTDTFPSGSGAPFAYCTAYIDATHYVSFLITETNIQATRNVGSGFESLATSAIDATANRWMRIRERGGTTYWEISPDGTTWTTLFSQANPIAVTALNISFETSNDGTEVADWLIDRILYAPAVDTFSIAAALDISPTLGVALTREALIAANLNLTPSLAVALSRETFIASALDLTPTLAANLTREVFVAAALDLGLVMGVNLEVTAAGAEYFIAASLDLGLNMGAALTREALIAANLPLDLQIATNLTREAVIAANLNISPTLAAALTRETFIAANLPINLQMAAALTREMFIAASLNLPVTVTVNMTRETFIAAHLDLGQAAEIRLILDMMIAANFPIGLPVFVNLRIEGGPVQMYIYRTLLGVG